MCGRGVAHGAHAQAPSPPPSPTPWVLLVGSIHDWTYVEVVPVSMGMKKSMETVYKAADGPSPLILRPSFGLFSTG
jgi:hypothetical protein